MLVRRTEEVEPVEVTEGGAKGVKMRVMLGEPEGAPHFIMRHFTVDPGGSTPRHSHSWEHEVYVLKGSGAVLCGDLSLIHI